MREYEMGISFQQNFERYCVFIVSAGCFTSFHVQISYNTLEHTLVILQSTMPPPKAWNTSKAKHSKKSKVGLNSINQSSTVNMSSKRAASPPECLITEVIIREAAFQCIRNLPADGTRNHLIFSISGWQFLIILWKEQDGDGDWIYEYEEPTPVASFHFACTNEIEVWGKHVCREIL
jgi:hypothetical protein